MRAWIFFAGTVIWAFPSWGAQSVAALVARTDISCVDAAAVGVCRRNTPPFVGVQMRFWQPVLFIETVKRSGACGINEFQPAVEMLAGQAARLAMKYGAGVDGEPSFASAGQADTGTTQMTEAHVFGFPLSDALSVLGEAPCEGPPDLGAVISYLSEQDAVEWRMARLEKYNPLAVMTERTAPVCDTFGDLFPGLCLGAWGPLYPRTGFVVHASEVVASAVAAFRAVDIAALKPQTPHQVISPVLFWPSVRQDRLQLVAPVAGRCMAIGEDPAFWDVNRRSEDGRYVWIYWRRKECCLF